MAATDDFAIGNILSKGGDDLPNLVYRGYLPDGQQIAVKRFSMAAWPDEEHFREEAIRVGRLRHRLVANLIGHCWEGDERLLVAEFMPNDTLATHLFHLKFKTMTWSRRLKVACYIAEALEYCSNEGQTLYRDLNSNKVLFDEAGNPCLSCFGLVKNRDNRSYSTNIADMSPECLNGRVTPESVIFSFGIVLRDLLSGKQISEDHALDMIMDKEIPTFMDSRLKGEYSFEEATALTKLAFRCLLNNPNDRPTIKEVNATLAQIQSNAAGAPPNAIPWTQKQDKTPPILQLTSFRMTKAVARMDLRAIHQILVLEHYKDDEASGEDWTPRLREKLEARKRGDSAFNSKDLKTAIECYSQFLDAEKLMSATVHVRRSLCYLMSGQPDKALSDAMQAQCIQANWPTAFYMQALALRQLNMNSDSAAMLKKATVPEEQRLMNGI